MAKSATKLTLRGTTDEAGNGHFLLQVEWTAASVHVAIDTTMNRLLMPQNPSRTFELHGQDTVIVFDQSLTLRARPKAPPASRVGTRHVPQRLD